ncbi:MAG: hypothetical protein RLZZ435_629 [Cyanobacteriota bacterium]
MRYLAMVSAKFVMLDVSLIIITIDLIHQPNLRRDDRTNLVRIV